MMMRILAVALAVAPFAAPALAQNAPINGLMTVYGDDPCPPEQICVRAPESERFRIPKDLRELEITPENRSWARRQEDSLNVGGTGTGSCSTVGAGGQTGCFAQEASRWKQLQQQKKKAEEDLPLN